SNPSRRQTRGQVDHDIFEGLPVRNWRRDAVTVAPPPAHDPFATAKDKWDVELPWGMPKDAHLMPQHSQDLLRAARSGRIYQKRMLVEEEDMEAEAALAEKAEKKEEAKEEGFVVRTWKLVPKHLEGPEIEYLAKRRKGLRGAPVKGVATMTKMTLRRTDEAGNTYVEDVVVPEGQVVQGEVIATTVILDPAAGAPAAGIQAPQPVKRRPPPPKRRAKGPGRGRRKKLPLPPRSAPAAVGAAQVDGQAPEAPKQEAAVDANGVKIEPSTTPAPGNEDTEMGDGSMAPSDDEGEGEGEGEGDDRSEGSEDEDQDGEGEGSQTHDQDDDNRMVLDNLPPEPKVPAPKPAISGDFPVETPHGEFGGQLGGQGATTGGSPLKHAFTPQSFSPTLSAEGGAENAPADAFGGDRLQGHFEQQQQFHGQEQQQQQQYPEPQQQQHQDHPHDGPAADTPSAFDVSATDFAGMLSGTPPQFGEQRGVGEEEEMLLDTEQGHGQHQLPDLSDFDPHANEAPEGEQGPGEEKFEDLLGSLEEHLNEGRGEVEEPMALVGVEEAAPAAVVEEAPVPVAEEQKPAEEEKQEEVPAAIAPDVVEPESAPAETETASAESKEAEPATVTEVKDISASPAKEAESVVSEASVVVEAEEPAAGMVVEEPAAPVDVEVPTAFEEAVEETPKVAAIVEEATEAVPEAAAPEEEKEEVKEAAPEITQESAGGVAPDVASEGVKEGEAVETAKEETEEKGQAAEESKSAA
ncbi:hypothetical protein V493_04694, partial [Pseudogymnoascus sp. VKM F-4281 (FW-2241)]